MPDFAFTSDWWVIPAGKKLPEGFTLSKDLTNGKFNGHYSIRSMADIKPELWKETLRNWAAENAVHISAYRKVKKHV